MRNNPHDKISHDSISWLGYDWGKVGYPSTPERRPLQIFFPEDEQELIDTLNAIGGNAIIRANGHSNNDLVLGNSDEPMICLRRLNSITSGPDGPIINQIAGKDSVKVQAGCELGDVEDALNEIGKGLPVMPDHRHITVGGITSAGGVNSACHLYGLFVDNIVGIDLIKKSDGTKISVTGDAVRDFVACTTNNDHILLSLDLVVLDINKRTELLELQSAGGVLNSEQDFIDAVKNFANTHSQDDKYFRGSWFSSIPGLPKPRFGVATSFQPVQNPTAQMWLQRAEYVNGLNAIGKHAGTLPPEIEDLETPLKIQVIRQLINNQLDSNSKAKYQTYEDIELFTDRVLDMSAGLPTGMFAMFVPLDDFDAAFKEVSKRFEDRRSKGQVAMYVIYSRVIDSEFLRGPQSTSDEKYIDISVFVGLPPFPSTAQANVLAKELDDVAADLNNNGSKCYRYMVTKTTFRPGTNDPRDTSHIWP